MPPETQLRMHIVTNIVKARKEKGLSQLGLAELLKVSRGFISLIESGRRPVPENLMEKIQKVLDISREQLMQKNDDCSDITSGKIWSVFGHITSDDRRKAYEILRAYAESNSEERERIYRAVSEIVMPPSEVSISDLLDMREIRDTFANKMRLKADRNELPVFAIEDHH